MPHYRPLTVPHVDTEPRSSLIPGSWILAPACVGYKILVNTGSFRALFGLYKTRVFGETCSLSFSLRRFLLNSGCQARRGSRS